MSARTAGGAGREDGFKNKPCGSPYAGSGFAEILPVSKSYFLKETVIYIEIYNRKHHVARGPVDAEIALRWSCYTRMYTAVLVYYSSSTSSC